MTAYDTAFDFTHGEEVGQQGGDGLVDDPSDRGGITKHGISLAFAGSIHLDINRDGVTDAADIKALTDTEAKELFKLHFWDKCRCDALPVWLALMAFDIAVNQGPGAAAVLMQRALGARPDGVIGTRTIAAAKSAIPSDVLIDLQARRAKRYASAPTFETHGNGWLRRNGRCLIAAMDLI